MKEILWIKRFLFGQRCGVKGEAAMIYLQISLFLMSRLNPDFKNLNHEVKELENHCKAPPNF